MKNVLIIHAHPERTSFCAALKDTAISSFEQNGDKVTVSDLYTMGFEPTGGKKDFLSLENPDFFKYQQEQVHAFKNDGFAADLRIEMDKLLACDLLIFNFPLWWFGLPAVLKGWVDRVFAMGLTYGAGKGVYEQGVFKDKTAMLCFTTGGPEVAYNGGKNGDLETILFPIQHGMFYFVGMTVLPAFISFAPARKTDEERKSELNRYKHYLKNLNSLQPIYTNRAIE